MSHHHTTLVLDEIARVEGQGALVLTTDHGRVIGAKLHIIEPPRYFEALLVGRFAREAPDLTSRICGICPVAYQLTACQAVERALAIRVDERTRLLRRLLACGEWVTSHLVHMIMLHAPDFLGVDDIVGLAKLHPERIRDALDAKHAGTDIMRVLGGRAIHPVTAEVGGFRSFPSNSEVLALGRTAQAAIGKAEETLAWMSSFAFPEHHTNIELVALKHGHEYPMNEGEIASTARPSLAIDEWETATFEYQKPKSTALFCALRDGQSYLTGPVARYALNHDLLSPRAKEAARLARLGPECRNMYRSILVRGVEVIYAFEEAIRILEALENVVFMREENTQSKTHPSSVSIGMAATEAPRGLLFHRYLLDEHETIVSANIISPTSQNQGAIEEHLLAHAQELSHTELGARASDFERIVRNYDPCISCATHFLTVRTQS